MLINSAKYTLFRKDFPQIKFRRIHLFEIPHSAIRKVHLPGDTVPEAKVAKSEFPRPTI